MDLKRLSAPIEALRPQLTETYQRLNDKWGEIVNCLESLPIPCDVSYPYSVTPDSRNYSCLTWKKYKGKRRICVDTYVFTLGKGYEVNTATYDQWSGVLRVQLLEHVPELFAAAEKATKVFIANARSAS